MRILVTGCNGMLGSNLMNLYSSKYNIVGASSKDFDITELDITIEQIKRIKPDIIIHSAAYTDVDGCESNTERAFKTNGLGTRNIAIAAQEVGATVVYISTDYVFDGKKDSPYLEHDTPNPLNVYGRSKLEGENYIKSILDKYYIVRTSWMFGVNGKNFVSTMLDLAKVREKVNVVYDQVGSPTYTSDLAGALKKLVMSGYYGTYHLTNSDYCSWFELAEVIYDIAGIKGVQLIPITTEMLNRPAVRPKNSRLEKFNWNLSGFSPLRSYKDAVTDYLMKVTI